MLQPCLAFFSLAILLTGCSHGTVKGKVGGETVPAMTEGLWVSFDFTGTQTVLLLATTIPDACEAYTGYAEQQAEAIAQYVQDFDAARLEVAFNEAERANLPEEYWSETLVVLPGSMGDVPGDYSLGEAFVDEAAFLVGHVTGYTDYTGAFTGEGEVSADGQQFTASSGVATVEDFEDEKGMSASGDADMVDEAGTDAGSVTWTLSGDWCEGYDDAING